MVNIYNYLKNVGQKVKKEITNNPLSFFIVLVLATIPLPYKYNSYAIIGLALFSIYNFKKEHFFIQKENYLLIATYILMAVSLLWTINFSVSLKALTKEVSFLLFPLIFSITPIISIVNKKKILYWFANIYALFGIFYLCKAIFRYIETNNKEVFFYHELVTFDVNAIHMSVFMVTAFFILFTKTEKKKSDILALLIIFLTILLLSSKNIIVLFFVLIGLYTIFINKVKVTPLKIGLFALVFLVSGILFYGKLKDRFEIEIKSNASERTVNDNISGQSGVVYNVSIKDAWSKPNFQPNDYFPGFALRVYQARIFFEMMQEDNAYFTGYGINASAAKIAQKRVEHNLYEGYEKFNFHNQYLQFFAEIGFFGFLTLIILLAINLKNALKNKDFVHFSFAVLMISLFLTESFLVRQRGIVFFTLMFCFFNMRLKNSSQTQNI